MDGCLWQFIRWVLDKETRAPLAERPDILLPTGCVPARDASGQWVVLLPSAWTAGYLEEKNPGASFSPTPPAAG